MLIKKFLLMNKRNTVLLYSYKTKTDLYKNIKPVRFKLTILIDNNRFNAEIKSLVTTWLLHHLLQQFSFFFKLGMPKHIRHIILILPSLSHSNNCKQVAQRAQHYLAFH